MTTQELPTLTHIFKDEVNVFIILRSDDIEEFNDVGMISKLLHAEERFSVTQTQKAHSGYRYYVNVV